MYTLPDTCSLLNVHPATLRRWMARAGVKTVQMDADLRLRYLRNEDVQQLAREHNRVVGNPDLVKLAAELAELKVKVAKLEEKVGQG